MRTSERGSTLLAALFLVIFLAGICAALGAMSVATSRGTRQTQDLHNAAWTAEAGVAYYLSVIEQDVGALNANPAPHDPLPMGEGTFRLVAAEQGSAPGQWTLGVETNVDSIDYRMFAVVGYRQYVIPQGLVVGGTGDPDDVAFKIAGAATMASYDPTVGPSVVNDNAGLWINGSAVMNGNTEIRGDATVTGTLDESTNSDITGEATENGPPSPVDDFSDYAAPLVEAAEASNDNAVLAAMFGAQYQPSDDGSNSGELDIQGGIYVIPPGNYNLSGLSIGAGASVTFDTIGGPSTVVITGDGDQGMMNIEGGSTVQVNPGGTSNGLMTVLGENTSMAVTSTSSFGQAIGDPYNAGYSQIISAGGTGTVSVTGRAQVYGRLGAPNLDLSVGGAASWFGAAVVRTATLAGSNTFSPKFMIDEGLQGSVLTDPEQFEVYTRWRDVPAPPTEGGTEVGGSL